MPLLILSAKSVRPKEKVIQKIRTLQSRNLLIGFAIRYLPTVNNIRKNATATERCIGVKVNCREVLEKIEAIKFVATSPHSTRVKAKDIKGKIMQTMEQTKR